MRTLASRFVAGALLALSGLGAAPPSTCFVGQIIIVGNENTPQQVILREIQREAQLYPGQRLSYPAVRTAERNLARLNIFEVSPNGGVRPTLTIVDDPANPDNPVKDILVTVQEANTGSLMFGLGVNSDCGLTGSIVLNERNFDIFNPPRSLDDFLNGSAWRGAGQEFRAEAVPGTQEQLEELGKTKPTETSDVVSVHYEVQESPPSHVGPISFPQPTSSHDSLLVSDVLIRGNRVVSTETLRQCLTLRPGIPFSPEALLADLAALNRCPKVQNARARQTSDGKGGARIIFQVRDYSGLVEDVVYRATDTGSTSIPREELERIAIAAGVRKGKFLDRAANKAACRGIVAACADWGRPLARCTWRKCGKLDRLQVIFDIQEGEVVRLDRICVTGNTFAGAEVLKNLLFNAAPALVIFDIEKGARPIFNLAAVNAAAAELVKYHRAFGFRHVSVERQLSFAADKTVLEFHIHEGKRSRVKPGPATQVLPCPPRGPEATPVYFEVSEPARPDNPNQPPAP